MFDELQARSPIPLLTIVEAACDAAAAAFAHSGIEVVRSEPAEMDVIHARYMDELERRDPRRPTGRIHVARAVEELLP